MCSFIEHTSNTAPSQFQALANALHNADMRLMLEINPTWTSESHIWFEESRKQSSTGGNIFREFYVWRGSRVSCDIFLLIEL